MAMSAEMTTDILMLMSTMTLRVAPKGTNTPTLRHTRARASMNHLDAVRKVDFFFFFLPRADKMAADQKISPMSAGMKRRPPMRFPYSCWNGSSMVT